MFFDPVRREYAQRIKKVKIFPGTPAVVTAVAGGGLVNGEGVTDDAASRTFYLEQLATVVASVGSSLEVSAEQKESSRPWTLDVYGNTTLVFQRGGQIVNLHQGGFFFTRDGTLTVAARVGDVLGFGSPILTVEVSDLTSGYSGTRLEMQYLDPTDRTRVDLHRGRFLITMARPMAGNLSLMVRPDAAVSVISNGVPRLYRVGRI